MKKLFKILSIISLLNIGSLYAQSYDCLEDQYKFNQCKFEVPKIKDGQVSVVKTESGLFEGRLVASCQNGKRVIVSESCDFAYGEEDACKGIKPNTWTGLENSTCTHNYQATAVNNGDSYKVYSIKGNGFIEYKCDNTELSIVSMECEPPTFNLGSQSVGSMCKELTYNSKAVFNYAENKYIPVPPNDNFCLNEGYDKMNSFVLLTSDSTIQSLGIAQYSVSCCETKELGTNSGEVIVTPVDGNCATVQGVLGGDYNDITGRNTTQPSGEKVLNNFCKPNAYEQLETFSVSSITNGAYVYDDEFQVTAMCCGLVNSAENNTDCKGQFLSSGATAEKTAQDLGVPYICDSSSGVMECYQNTCTDFVAEENLCAECDLGDNYSFSANENVCFTPVETIYSGHKSTTKLDSNTHSGYATISCMNGTELVEDARCFKKCPDTNLTWESPNGGVCTFKLSTKSGNYRHYLKPEDDDLTNPNLEQGDKTGSIVSTTHTGAAAFHCDDGNWVENSEHLEEPFCFASCDSEIVRWGTGISKSGVDKTNACSASINEALHFQQPTNFYSKDPMNNVIEAEPTILTTTEHTGSAGFSCNDGEWFNSSTQTCMLDCEQQTVSWTVGGNTCSATVSGLAHGGYRNNVNATGTNIGQSNLTRSESSLANFRCDDGLFVLDDANPTCWADCQAGSDVVDSEKYENVCTYSWDLMRHKDSSSVNATGGGTGSGTLVCENGNITYPDGKPTCFKKCSTGAVNWNRTSGEGNNCPTGFTESGGICTKTDSVIPGCPTSGYTFNSTTNKCEKEAIRQDSNDANIVCENNYSNYTVTGKWDCQKSYNYPISCPDGYNFNGTECERAATQSEISTWSCPTTSSNPTSPSGARASSWSYKETYKDVSVTDVEPNCKSGFTFDSSTGKCKTTSTEVGTWGEPNGTFDLTSGLECNTTKNEYDYMNNKRTKLLSGTCSNVGTKENYTYCASHCEPVECRVGTPCPRTYCEPVTQECKGTQAVYETPTCDAGYVLQSSGYCRKEEDKTDVCVRNITVTPTCASGYTWNSSQSKCVGTTTYTPTLSCDSGSFLVSDGQTMYNNEGINCGVKAVNGQCCTYSDLGCEKNPSFNEKEAKELCDWVTEKPSLNCSQGSLSGNTCLISDYKDGSCPAGYTMSNGTCKTVEVIDATETCTDGSAAPCTVKPLVAASCTIQTLDDGTKVTPNVSGVTCQYNHIATGVAVAKCPSGQTVLGDQCIKNTKVLLTEDAVCSNNGVVENGMCVKTESFEAVSTEPVQCSVTATARNHGGSRSLTDNTTNGATGSATATCNDGDWIVSNDLCYKDCASTISAASVSTGTLEWNLDDPVGSTHDAYGLKCSHSNITTTNYGHKAEKNKISTLNENKLVGETSYSCDDGWWIASNQSCDRIACSSEVVNWVGQSTCSNSTPSNLKWGDETTLAHPTGYSGNTEPLFKCSDSSGYSLENTPDCNADCNTNSGSTGFSFGNCYISMNDYLSNDDTSTYNDITGSSRGTTTVTCDNGTLTNSNDLCKPVAESGNTVYWGSSNCQGTLSNNLMPSGGVKYGTYDGCETVTNTNTAYTGSVEACADDNPAGYILNGVSNCYKKCVEATVSWGNCSDTAGARIHGETRSLSFDSGDDGYSGTATATCSNGNWTLSNKVCTENCSSTEFEPTTCPSGYTYNSSTKLCDNGTPTGTWEYNSFAEAVCGDPNPSDMEAVQGTSCNNIGSLASSYSHECYTQCEGNGRGTATGFCGGEPNGFTAIELKCTAGSNQTKNPTCPSGSTMLENGKCIDNCAYEPPPPPTYICSMNIRHNNGSNEVIKGNEDDIFVFDNDTVICDTGLGTQSTKTIQYTYTCRSTGVWEITNEKETRACGFDED